MRKMWNKALAMMLSLAMVASSFSGFALQAQAEETGKVVEVAQTEKEEQTKEETKN